ncbi:MAG TPA: inosine-5-monophosphate dehydrogenase, partial [Propionibacteriaceae bacterium]|nr:inosine-5-monophosphate dehydrogenase [Propionibacteriaceae bacterium]
VGPTDSVRDALALMAAKGIGALVVLDGDQVVGILSERDYAREVELKGRTARETAVGEIMTGKVAYVEPDNTVEECMALMTHKRIRHLPVIENGRLVGLVSIGDVVKTIISHQQFLIEQLEHYITTG